MCVAILILRKIDPDRERPFKVPFCPWFPLLGIICCGGLMIYSMSLKKLSSMLFLAWIIIGVACYLSYSYKQQRLAQGETLESNEENNV